MDQETARIVVPTIASLLVGFLGSGSAMVVLFRTLRNQRDAELRKDNRGLRDATRERLRAEFVTVNLAAMTISWAAHRGRSTLEGETDEG